VSALTRANGIEFDALIPTLSRRLDTASRVYLRNGEEALQAEIFGEQAFGINELQLELLRSLDGNRRSLADTATELAGEPDPAEARAALLYLADRGAIELVPSRGG